MTTIFFVDNNGILYSTARLPDWAAHCTVGDDLTVTLLGEEDVVDGREVLGDFTGYRSISEMEQAVGGIFVAPVVGETLVVNYFLNFPKDAPSTETNYGGRQVVHPRHAAFRGKYRLAYQSQQVRRDLTGEELSRHVGQTMVACFTDASYRAEMNSPYTVLVYAPGCSSINFTAFRTIDEFNDWMSAYNLTADIGITPWFSIQIGPTDGWKPLEIRPVLV